MNTSFFCLNTFSRITVKNDLKLYGLHSENTILYSSENCENRKFFQLKSRDYFQKSDIYLNHAVQTMVWEYFQYRQNHIFATKIAWDNVIGYCILSCFGDALTRQLICRRKRSNFQFFLKSV